MNLIECSKRIEEIISDPEYIPQKPQDFATLVGITTESDEGDMEAFWNLIYRLEKTGKIVFTKRGKISSPKNAGLICGTFRGTSKFFGFVTTDETFSGKDKKDIFIPASKTLFALDGDRVFVRLLDKGGPSGKKGKKAKYNEKRFKRAKNGKLIPISKEEIKEDKGPEGEIAGIIQRASEERKIIGIFHTLKEPRGRKYRRICYVQPDSKKIPYSVFVSAQDVLSATEGDKVEVLITVYPSEKSDMQGKITRVFGNAESKQANYDAILAENGIETEFSETVLKEAQKRSEIPIESDRHGGRKDFRDKIIFTIDGEDAKDLDDAISLEAWEDGYRLYVHIADVSEYVRAGTELDRCAMRRGTSVYFTDKVVPMLPKALSNGSCSLNCGEDRYALSAVIDLDSKGEIIECEPTESIIRSCVRGVYSEINDIFENGKSSEFYSKYEKVYDMLCLMHNLYLIMKKRSIERGAVELETSEAKVIVNEKGYPIDIVPRERGDAEKLIEQFMLCANEGIAIWLSRLSLPCVYRVHEAPSEEKLKSFATFAFGLGMDIRPLKTKSLHPSAYATILEQAKEKGLSEILSTVMLRSMMKAKYSSVPGSHFGLSIPLYCHFTSPIRRYPDLSVHRIVKAALRGEIIGKKLSSLSSFAEKSALESSQNELRALEAERDITDLYKTLYMSDKVGESYDGVIGSVTPFGFFVTLQNTVEGLVPIESLGGKYVFDEKSYTLSCTKKAYRLGQRVRVCIERADLAQRRIFMSVYD